MDFKRKSALGFGHRHPRAVARSNGADQCQPQTVALDAPVPLGAGKAFEGLGLQIVGQAGAGVADANPPAAVLFACADLDGAGLAGGFDRLTGVADKVRDDPVKLLAVASDGEAGRHVSDEIDKISACEFFAVHHVGGEAGVKIKVYFRYEEPGNGLNGGWSETLTRVSTAFTCVDGMNKVITIQ